MMEDIMALDKRLLDILVCPACKSDIKPVKNETALKCTKCFRVYPVREGIPVMLIDEAVVEPENG